MPVFVSSESGGARSIFDWLNGQRQPTPERYLRDMAFLERVWQQTVPGLSFQVVHDQPDQLPGQSTRIAMAFFASLRRYSLIQKWFIRHIRSAVVHCAVGPDAIAVVGDSIHFYEAKAIPSDLGPRLFDRLTQEQKRDLAQLYAGHDAREVFATFVNNNMIADMSHPDEDSLRELSEQIGQLSDVHASTVLLTSATELNEFGGDDSSDVAGWSDELNERRIELIDKDIQGSLSTEERVELAELQRKATAYRDRIAPLPIEGAKRLHQHLLEVKRQREGG